MPPLRPHRPAERTLIVALLAGIGGCVVPLSPQFEDEKNLPPYLISASPSVGTLSGENPTFTITVQDPNPADTFYVRWLIDYPPYDSNTKQLADNYPKPSNPAIIDFTPDCVLHSISNTVMRHRLMVVVSDRPFLPPKSAPPDRPYDVTVEGSYPLRVVWLFNLECHSQ